MAKKISPMVTIENCSRQPVRLQIRPPKSDFYINEQQVRLSPGKSIEVPKDYLLWSQIQNLKGRSMIRTIES